MIKPIASNSMILLHSLLLINVFINSICAGVLFLIVRNIIKEHAWEINYPMITLITIICSLIISNQVLTKNVTNENIYMLCYYIAIYIIAFGNKRKKEYYKLVILFYWHWCVLLHMQQMEEVLY